MLIIYMHIIIIIIFFYINFGLFNFHLRSLYIFWHFGLQELVWDCCKQPHLLVDTLQRPTECSRRGQCVPRSWRQHHWLVTEVSHLQSLFSGKVHWCFFSWFLIFRVAQCSWRHSRTWAPSLHPQHYWSLWPHVPS